MTDPCRYGKWRRLARATIRYWLVTFPAAVCLTIFGAIGLHACSASGCWMRVDATCSKVLLMMGLSHTLLVTTLMTFAAMSQYHGNNAIPHKWLCYANVVIAACIVLPTVLSVIGVMGLDACASRVCWHGLGNDWALVLLLLGQFYMTIYGLTEASTIVLMNLL